MTETGVEFTTQIYVVLMTEVRERLNELARLLKITNPDTIREPGTVFELESCYLQSRLICESIALASLAAHHSEALNAGLLKKWNADEIFNALERVNPDCFPRAMRGERTGEGQLHFAELDPPGMDRDQLAEIYHLCSNALHRGALKSFFKGVGKNYDPGELKGWLDELWRLLEVHVVAVPHLRKALVVEMFGADGQVTVHESHAGGDFVVQREGG